MLQRGFKYFTVRVRYHRAIFHPTNKLSCYAGHTPHHTTNNHTHTASRLDSRSHAHTPTPANATLQVAASLFTSRAASTYGVTLQRTPQFAVLLEKSLGAAAEHWKRPLAALGSPLDQALMASAAAAAAGAMGVACHCRSTWATWTT